MINQFSQFQTKYSYRNPSPQFASPQFEGLTLRQKLNATVTSAALVGMTVIGGNVISEVPSVRDFFSTSPFTKLLGAIGVMVPGILGFGHAVKTMVNGRQHTTPEEASKNVETIA